jgi:hypothetical protein
MKQCPALATSSKSSNLTSNNTQSPSASTSPLIPPSNSIGHHHHHHHHMNHYHSNHGHHHGVNYHFSHSIKLTERSRSALISLLLLLIENYHQVNMNKSSQQNEQHQQQPFNSDLLNYLLTIFENLPNFKWIEDTFATNCTANNYSSSISSKSN